MAYEKAGADIIFLEAPHSVDEMKKVAQSIKSPLLANMIKTYFRIGVFKERIF